MYIVQLKHGQNNSKACNIFRILGQDYQQASYAPAPTFQQTCMPSCGS